MNIRQIVRTLLFPPFLPQLRAQLGSALQPPHLGFIVDDIGLYYGFQDGVNFHQQPNLLVEENALHTVVKKRLGPITQGMRRMVERDALVIMDHDSFQIGEHFGIRPPNKKLPPQLEKRFTSQPDTFYQSHFTEHFPAYALIHDADIEQDEVPATDAQAAYFYCCYDRSSIQSVCDALGSGGFSVRFILPKLLATIYMVTSLFRHYTITEEGILFLYIGEKTSYMMRISQGSVGKSFTVIDNQENSFMVPGLPNLPLGPSMWTSQATATIYIDHMQAAWRMMDEGRGYPFVIWHDDRITFSDDLLAKYRKMCNTDHVIPLTVPFLTSTCPLTHILHMDQAHLRPGCWLYAWLQGHLTHHSIILTDQEGAPTYVL